MGEFHFLRPWWLLVIPVGLMLFWLLLRRATSTGAWVNLIDEALRPHVLSTPPAFGGRRGPSVVAALACVLAGVALAGPSWERIEVPAFRSDDALVVVFDMSRSMDAADVEPSRLERARLKLLELLERRAGGQTALVVFSTHAFTVTPLTTDTRTIAAMVGVLGTDIMPTQGSAPHTGLERAGELLRQAGSRDGSVLMITDTQVTARSLDVAARLSAEGHRVSVLAVGTEQGAPIRLASGGFLTDGRGGIVIPRVDMAALRNLAEAGGGRFAMMTPDSRDLDSLLVTPTVGARQVSAQEEDRAAAEIWLDRGALVVAMMLPLLLLGFRRGWIAMIVCAMLLPVPRAEAAGWSALWQRSDQRGASAMQAGDPAEAAALFNDREWRAAALYRAGDFEASADALQGYSSARAHYNRGNALARAGRVPEAIEAYDAALDLEPDHQDALHNRTVLQELMEDNPELAASGQPPQPDPAAGNDHAGDGEEGPADTQQPPEGLADSGEQSGDTDAGDDVGRNDAADLSQRQARGEPPPDAGEAEGTAAEAELGIEDVEQWASQQAAEQWLRRVPQDPGGLLRRKFELQYRRLAREQDRDLSADEVRPW